MILAVIFDFDNTLYNYELSNKNALHILFQELSISCNIKKNIIEELYNTINYNIKHSNNVNNKFNKTIYIKQLLEKLNIPLYEYYKYLTIYESNFEIKMYDYIEVFKLLKKNNIKIAICSNNIFIQQMNKLNNMNKSTNLENILEYIDYLETSDECGEEKPNTTIFLKLQHKLQISFENIAYVGDSYPDDIVPALELKMFPFHFIKDSNFSIQNYIEFGNFNQLHDFFCNYFKIINEFICLSKYFGQSLLNVQGQGGNISIKLNDLLFIKSSGAILGNVNYTHGYCIANNNLCLELFKHNDSNLKKTKIFGNNPSMETFFHSYMKKYTVHLHFTLSNMFFCSNTIELTNFKYKYSVIEYEHPGLLLAKEIYKQYNNDTNIYFLKNHGIIITSNIIEELIDTYEYIYEYFNQLMNHAYNDLSFQINKMYNIHDTYKIIRKYDYPCELLKNIIYCFPDLAIFVEKIGIFDSIHDFKINDYNIIIIDKDVYLCADNINKLYSLIEIIDSYKLLSLSSSQFENKLISVDSTYLNNMEEEKIRKYSNI